MWFVVSIKLACRVITNFKGGVRVKRLIKIGEEAFCLGTSPLNAPPSKHWGNEAFLSILEITNFSQLHDDDSVERTWHVLIDFGNWQGGQWQGKYIKLCIIYHKYDGRSVHNSTLSQSLDLFHSSHNMHTILTDGKSVGGTRTAWVKWFWAGLQWQKKRAISNFCSRV